MAIWHGKSRRKPTGGLRHSLRARKKRKREMGRDFIPPVVSDEEKRKVIEGMGYTIKIRVPKVKYANVADPKTGKVQKVEVLGVQENRANRHFTRMNVITKGAVVKTPLGLARVTSRPNQDGVVNAVLIE